jgi:hypothetical protein
MATLTGNSVASTYDSLIKLSDNGSLTTGNKDLSDGLGNNLPLQASTTAITFTGTADFTGATVVGLSTTDTTYDLSSAQNASDVDIKLVGSDATTDTVKLVAGTNVTLTDNGSNQVTIDAAGGGGTPGGSNTHVQFNDGGVFGGSANFTWNNSTNVLTLTGTHAILGSLLQTGDYTNSTGNMTLTSGDLTLSGGNIDLTGNININGNINLTTNDSISWGTSTGGNTKPDGIEWPDANSWGEDLNTYATGETLAVGTTTTTTDGLLYCFRTSGGWVPARADSQITGAGLLGYMVNSVTTNRFVIRGLISVNSGNIDGTPAIGSVLYVSDANAGFFDATAPSGGTNFARKVGQIVDSYVSGRTTYYKIWFDPDWYYV